MSLSTQVLVGLFLGILTGIFFGEEAARIQFVGDAFIRLLQMTAMPFILVSLVAALGKLDMRTARDLALKAGSFLLVVWLIVLAIIAMLPSAFPPMEAASFFSSSLVAEPVPFDFLSLYIPSNPSYALSHNVVPALVLFSVVLGVSIIPVPGKEGVLRALDVLADTLTRITASVARLAPIGVFALIASATGTIGIDEFELLQVYLVVYALLAGLLAFVILPGLVSALTPLSWREIVLPIRDPIITAFAAGNLLIVIPILTREARRIVASRVADSGRAGSAVEVIVPASFNFPSAGKLLSLAFIPFAAWLSGSSIALGDYFQFLITGLFSFFAVTSIAIPFLLDLLRLPHDLFQIFLAVDVITGRLQVMVAAMCTVVLALLGAFAMTGALQFQVARLARFAGIAVLSVGLTLAGVRVIYGNVLDLESTSYGTFVEMDLSAGKSTAVFKAEEPPVPTVRLKGSRLDRIEQDRVLRVCYFKDSLPWAFVNASNKLVGFDVEMAYAMARELSVSVEFVRVDRSRMGEHLDGGTCDIAMSGTAITPNRTRASSFSDPYLTNHLAFVVEDHGRDRFSRWETLAELPDLRILVPPADHFVALLKARLPNATTIQIEDLRGYLRGEGEADAMLNTAEAGSAWTLVYPQFAVVVPKPGNIEVQLGYPLPRKQADFKIWVDAWILAAKSQGDVDTLFDHWILGRSAGREEPRWSILNNILRPWLNAEESTTAEDAPADAADSSS